MRMLQNRVAASFGEFLHVGLELSLMICKRWSSHNVMDPHMHNSTCVVVCNCMYMSCRDFWSLGPCLFCFLKKHAHAETEAFFIATLCVSSTPNSKGNLHQLSRGPSLHLHTSRLVRPCSYFSHDMPFVLKGFLIAHRHAFFPLLGGLDWNASGGSRLGWHAYVITK